MGLQKTYSETPPAGKIIMLLLGGFVAWKGYGLIKENLFPSGTTKADKGEETNNQQTVVENKKYLDKLVKLSKPTYSDAMYKGWADVLYKAMDGIGTSVPVINNVFGYMTTDTDVVKLIDTFGVRNRKTNNPFSSDATPLNLRSWLAEELASYEIDNLNKILYKKNIAYRF